MTTPSDESKADNAAPAARSGVDWLFLVAVLAIAGALVRAIY